MTRILETKTLFDGWTKFSLARLRGRDGREFERVIEDHGASASVLAFDPVRRTAILVKQFRAPVCHASGQVEVLEAIAGRTEGKDARETAIRESMEEAGLKLDALEEVAAVWVLPGVSTERMTLYFARYSPASRVAAGGGEAAEHEDIAVVEMSLENLATMADSGTLDDMKTFALVQTLRLREPALFS